MEIKELISESLNTFKANKVRTGLATLGVVIGIASVISLLSLGKASQYLIESQIESLGSNLLIIYPGRISRGGIRGAMGGATTLTYEDAQAIVRSSQITTVKSVSPEFYRNAQVTAGKSNTNTLIYGVTPTYFSIRKVDIEKGVSISQKDVETIAKVAVLGPQVVTDLFGEGANPVGETIRINRIAFKVIGVTKSKGGTGFFNQDDRVFIPLTTAQKIVFGVDYLSSISVETKSKEVMTEAQNQIGYLLLERHRLSDPTSADFQIMSQADILSTATQVTQTFTYLLAGIAAISLLVGGIGIMNIMLVTVTERTREIGLRKALGATKKIITTQFLTEAVIITFSGGLLGIILGILIFGFLSRIMDLPFVISPSAIILAFGVSTAVGILFGWYPAQKAAKLEPIEALRYE
ncbi:MAG: ABC transporter permease [Microgenomates group bacterium]